MKSQQAAIKFLFGLLFFVSVTLADSAIGQAAEPAHFWTTVGSAGVPGPVTRKCVSTINPFILILNCSPRPTEPIEFVGASIGLADVPAYSGPVAAPLPDYEYDDKVVVRYNVTAVEGLFTDSANGIRMMIRYLDTNDRSQILVKLIEFNLTTGASTTRLSFDSNQFVASNSYQVRYSSDTTKPDFDFVKNAYYIEATLRMTQPTIYGLGGAITAPKLASVRLEKTFLLNGPIDVSIPEP